MKPRSSRAQHAPAPTLDTPHTLGYRMPAEWEPHAATWLAWPHEPTDWPGKFAAIPWVFAEVAKNLQDGERIRVIVSGKAEEKNQVGQVTGFSLTSAESKSSFSSKRRS